MDEHEITDEIFADWVLDNKFQMAINVRKLPEILNTPQALEAFKNDNFAAAKEFLSQPQIDIGQVSILDLSEEIQKKLTANKQTLIHVDLKPMNSENELLVKLQNSSERTITNKLKKALNLNSLHIELIKNATSKDEYLALEKISTIIKKIPISIHSSFSMDEAISTSGGIHTNELNENFELKKRTTIFCIGEMVNWNAPTGGYLLQGCFSMGVKTAHYLNTL